VNAAKAAAKLAAQDRGIAKLLAKHGPPTFKPQKGSHFAALAESICYQQLAGKAAQTIHGRFLALVAGDPTPKSVLKLSVEQMRGAGLSGNKTASIRDLAEKVDQGVVELDSVSKLGDDELIAELVLVRGIGVWTAQMFLIFQLGRVDVWPALDYGVRAGYAKMKRLPAMLTPKEMEPAGDKYKPYRSVAAWYCWRELDTVTPGKKASRA
jgi:DNA-3-methyladenine glycosylase II